MNAIDGNPSPEPQAETPPYDIKSTWPFWVIAGASGLYGYAYDDWTGYVGTLLFIGISAFTVHLGHRIQVEMAKETAAPDYVKPPPEHGVLISRGRRWILGKPGLFVATPDRLLWSRAAPLEGIAPGAVMSLAQLAPFQPLGDMLQFEQFHHHPRLFGGDALRIKFQPDRQPKRVLMVDPEGLPLLLGALRLLAREQGWQAPDEPEPSAPTG